MTLEDTPKLNQGSCGVVYFTNHFTTSLWGCLVFSLGPIFVEVSIFHVTKTQVAENLFCLLFTLLEINSLGWFGWEVSEIRWEGLLA